MNIRPIRSKADHRRALREIEALWNCEPGTPEHERLEVLSVLVDTWEREHHPIERPDPVESIRFRMEQLGWSRKDLEPILGTRARVAEILNGKRSLTLAMIRRLHHELGVPAESLIGPPAPA